LLPLRCQALCSAGSLDEVRTAAAAFLGTVSNLCNARSAGKGTGGTWRHVGKVLAQLMDFCLAAAAAAARLQELRQLLDQVRPAPAWRHPQGKHAYCSYGRLRLAAAC
jgi:exopolyphosphatase/pppGpp-phosphohydrolase